VSSNVHFVDLPTFLLITSAFCPPCMATLLFLSHVIALTFPHTTSILSRHLTLPHARDSTHSSSYHLNLITPHHSPHATSLFLTHVIALTLPHATSLSSRHLTLPHARDCTHSTHATSLSSRHLPLPHARDCRWYPS